MTAITVVLVEPQIIFLRGVERDLEGASDINVVGTTTTGTEGLALVRDLTPHVALIALQMKDLDGMHMLEELKDMFSTKTLILTAEENEQTVFDCLMLGAQGYLFKYSVTDLAESIRRAHAGEIVMCSHSLRAFIRAVRTNQAQHNPDARPVMRDLLTRREREVLTMVGRGTTNAEIAVSLAVAPTTVKTHLRNAYAKLGVSRSAAAVQKALDLGEIDRRRA